MHFLMSDGAYANPTYEQSDEPDGVCAYPNDEQSVV
jgi:hypothetical protein